VRQDIPTGALQPPYEGPYEVISRGEKIFRIKIRGKTVTVTIDRLKPAYTLEDKETSREPESQPMTRSGRTTKPPVRFKL